MASRRTQPARNTRSQYQVLANRTEATEDEPEAPVQTSAPRVPTAPAARGRGGVRGRGGRGASTASKRTPPRDATPMPVTTKQRKTVRKTAKGPTKTTTVVLTENAGGSADVESAPPMMTIRDGPERTATVGAPTGNPTRAGPLNVRPTGAESSPPESGETVAQALTKAIQSLVGLQTAPKPYAPRMEVPSFYGESSKALKWLRQYEAASETNRWDGLSKLAGLRKAFRERAATWFKVAYNNKLPTTYEKFQTDFKAMWLSDELVRAAKERFFRLTQRADESPLDYLIRLKWHRMEISDWVSESDLLGRAQSGLLDKYRCQGLGLEKTLR